MRDYRKTLESLDIPLSETELALSDSISQIKKHTYCLEKELEQLADTCDEHTELKKQYQSVPGVSGFVATLITQYLSPTYSTDPKQWIAFTGLDISVRQSGVWKGRDKLTKRGNTYLRKRLFCAAWGAIMHDEQFRAYYDLLRSKGHPYVESLLIIARKQLRIMWNLAQTNEYYDPSKVAFPI